ncbi:hypothetical protein MAPG_11486 [Magnaporthiopsis poae ATCC 64411]|uniref:Uncharacterized protein n=1 Tax=Magnaporthiopsis poae (strain ATCC 64411 / 73-15) TaxID=644358 RepID=A0A0C4EFE3_MAGP6|nr:hypothetical protein MAPG_11486 [Magnaporthiopsis poae ATCC 64411]
MTLPNTLSAHQASEDQPPLSIKGDLARLRWSAKNPPADPAVTFAGKTVLVTGANTGLGFAAALSYASKGASRLILAVRSAAKGEAAAREIAARTGMAASSIVVATVDLASFASVRDFAARLAEITPRLDVALLNAGLASATFRREEAGWETAVQVNVLATALMAVLILPLLQAAAPDSGGRPHLTFVNSIGHAEVQREWLDGSGGSLLQAANDEAAFDQRKHYGMVKLLAMAAVRAIARSPAVGGTDARVIVNSCCPHLCKTDLGREFPLVQRAVTSVFQAFFARSAEEGARTLVGATALGSESHGRFWHHDVLYPVGDLAQDDAFMDKTWAEMKEVLVQVQPDLDSRLNAAL